MTLLLSVIFTVIFVILLRIVYKRLSESDKTALLIVLTVLSGFAAFMFMLVTCLN